MFTWTVVWRHLCGWGLQFAFSASRWHYKLSFALNISECLMAKGRLCQKVLSVDPLQLHVCRAWHFAKSMHT